MKWLSIIFITFAFISCTDTESTHLEKTEPTTCDCNSLILDNGYNRFYLTDRKEPFTGKCIIIYTDGVVKTERNLVNGKYHGDLIDYYTNGQIEKITEYDTHFINGFQKTYTPKGDLVSHQIFKRSQLVETIK